MLLLCSPSHLPVRTCPCATPHPTPRVSPPPPPRAPPTSTFSVLPAGGLGPPVPSGSFPRWWAGDLGAVQRPGKCVPFYTPPDLWRDFGETRGPPRTSAGGRDGHRESLPSRWGGPGGPAEPLWGPRPHPTRGTSQGGRARDPPPQARAGLGFPGTEVAPARPPAAFRLGGLPAPSGSRRPAQGSEGGDGAHRARGCRGAGPAPTRCARCRLRGRPARAPVRSRARRLLSPAGAGPGLSPRPAACPAPAREPPRTPGVAGPQATHSGGRRGRVGPFCARTP